MRDIKDNFKRARTVKSLSFSSPEEKHSWSIASGDLKVTAERPDMHLLTILNPEKDLMVLFNKKYRLYVTHSQIVNVKGD